MEAISITGVLPAVFADAPPLQSDVWRQRITLHRGKRYLLMAPSGTGKTSLCAYLTGLRADYSGTIAFDGHDISRFSAQQWSAVRRRELAYLPQDMGLFNELTALENIRLKNCLTDFRSEHDILMMLQRLGVGDCADKPAGRLSAGQKQRVAVVQTLCQPADFILLDEPVSHLDAANNDVVAALIAEQAEQLGAALLVTSVGNDLKLHFDHILHL